MSFKFYKDSLTVLVVIIATVVSVTNCQINVTEFIEDENSTVTPVFEPDPPPDIWCPNNNKVLDFGDYFATCLPSPCLLTDINHPHEPLIDNFTEVVNFNETVREICAVTRRINKSFISQWCQPVRLTIGQDFNINYTDGSMFEFQTNLTYKLGDYVYQPDTGEAVICRNETLPNDDVTDVSVMCSSHRLNVTKHEIYPNGSLYLPHLDRVVRRGYYKIEPSTDNGEQGTVIDVCLRLSVGFFSCHLYDVGKKFYKLQPDLSLWTNDGAEIVYPVDKYMMAASEEFATVCVEARAPWRKETRYLYVTAFVLSSIFSFLTLLVHLFYPQLNYHAKALLCHVISLFIMYVSMTIRTSVGHFSSTAGYMLMFGVQYVSSLAAFLWINVLAYELWKVFSNMRGKAGSLGNQGAKRRWFIVKCLYAWGIPLAMYFFIIGLMQSPRAVEYFHLELRTGWFTSEKDILYFFYIPLFFILLENLIFFGLTVWNIRSASRGTDILNKKVSRQLLRVFIKLLVVMGLCWFAEIVSWYFYHKTDEAAWYFTDLINALQGVAIFLVYVCKKSTYRIIKKRWRGQTGSSATKSTNSTSSDSRSRKISNMSNTAIAMTTIQVPDQNVGGSKVAADRFRKLSNVSDNMVRPLQAAQ